ncbi:MAG: hypothetical protein K0Q72_2534, partial [Armatimonadetes bacterium]|nr:hypothetical protein [Armatimonadota bacterium]
HVEEIWARSNGRRHKPVNHSVESTLKPAASTSTP